MLLCRHPCSCCAVTKRSEDEKKIVVIHRDNNVHEGWEDKLSRNQNVGARAIGFLLFGERELYSVVKVSVWTKIAGDGGTEVVILPYRWLETFWSKFMISNHRASFQKPTR